MGHVSEPSTSVTGDHTVLAPMMSTKPAVSFARVFRWMFDCILHMNADVTECYLSQTDFTGSDKKCTSILQKHLRPQQIDDLFYGF